MTIEAFSFSHSIVGDCRGLGLCQAIEIVTSKVKKTPAPKLAQEVSRLGGGRLDGYRVE